MQFISKCAQKGVPTTTFCLKEKALEIAKRENLINFKASEGYIHRFKKRNKICFENIHGEAGGVNEDVCSEWLDVKLPKHLEDYAPKDIYNADELGLFWRVTPEKTYLIKGNKCKKGKQAKERVTVLTCANMDGSDKLQLVVIGKSANPHSFKNARHIPVSYFANNAAWMTATIFKAVLTKYCVKYCEVINCIEKIKRFANQIDNEDTSNLIIHKLDDLENLVSNETNFVQNKITDYFKK